MGIVKPVCPYCGNSQGIWSEAGCEVEWSRGEWRMRFIIEGPLSDHSAGCKCGASFMMHEAWPEDTQ